MLNSLKKIKMKPISNLVENAIVTPELDEVFVKIKKALKAPFTPNFFKVWGVSPESLEGIWPVMDNILTGGNVNRKLKEMIFVAISSLKKCHYCEAAHHAFCLNIGVTPSQIDELINNYTCEGADEKIKVAINYAVKLAKDSNSGTQDDFDNLISLGYNESDIMELIAMSSMAVFYNHLANATKINIDSEFTKMLESKRNIAV